MFSKRHNNGRENFYEQKNPLFLFSRIFPKMSFSSEINSVIEIMFNERIGAKKLTNEIKKRKVD